MGEVLRALRCSSQRPQRFKVYQPPHTHKVRYSEIAENRR